MKVIKFEVSFKSDGTVAGLVARATEGGQWVGPQMPRGSLCRALQWQQQWGPGGCGGGQGRAGRLVYAWLHA